MPSKENTITEVNVSINFSVCRTDQKPITQDQYERIKFFIETLIEESEGEFSILPITDQEAKIDCFYKSFIY